MSKAIKLKNNLYLASTEVVHKRGGGWYYLSNLLDNIHPVGSIFISLDSTNPSEYFGGTWERFAQGRFLMGAGAPKDNNYNLFGSLNANGFTGAAGEMGGQYWHTLTVDEIPSHNHKLDRNFYTFSERMYGYLGDVYKGTLVSNATQTTTNVGGGQHHNNVPPYIGVYIWKRTA